MSMEDGGIQLRSPFTLNFIVKIEICYTVDGFLVVLTAILPIITLTNGLYTETLIDSVASEIKYCWMHYFDADAFSRTVNYISDPTGRY